MKNKKLLTKAICDNPNLRFRLLEVVRAAQEWRSNRQPGCFRDRTEDRISNELDCLDEELGLEYSSDPSDRFRAFSLGVVTPPTSLLATAHVPRAPMEPPWEELDGGIRETVRWLWTLGFDTTDSGDGKLQGNKALMAETGEALPVPHVFMVCPPNELLSQADRLRSACETLPCWKHIPGTSIQATYFALNGIAVIELYGLSDEMLGK